jgi:hypothetical protein
METMFVKPSEHHINTHSVAYWDNNPAHIEANPDWQQWGGAFIVGVSESPDAIYEVADAPEVHIAIRQGRLVDVTKEVFESVLNDDLDTDENPEQDENEIISTDENNVFNESDESNPTIYNTEWQIRDYVFNDVDLPVTDVTDVVVPTPKPRGRPKKDK